MSSVTNYGREISWDELSRLEPRLGVLLEEARSFHDAGGASFCANATWRGGLRTRLLDLVGYRRKGDGSNPRLATSSAYDTAYRAVYKALPDCRNCPCVALWEAEVTPRLAESGR